MMGSWVRLRRSKRIIHQTDAWLKSANSRKRPSLDLALRTLTAYLLKKGQELDR